MSFIERGRSLPGMVVRLAEALEVPLRDRNALLLAAGYAPAYPQRELDDPELDPIRTALDLVEAPANLARLLLRPEGLAARILNMDEWGRHVLDAMRRKQQPNPGAGLDALLEELEPLVPPRPREPSPRHLGFAVPLRLSSSSGDLERLTTLTHFATTVDVTISELTLEAFIPGDAATAAHFASPSA